jgi:hypothetical protein
MQNSPLAPGSNKDLLITLKDIASVNTTFFCIHFSKIYNWLCTSLNEL